IPTSVARAQSWRLSATKVGRPSGKALSPKTTRRHAPESPSPPAEPATTPPSPKAPAPAPARKSPRSPERGLCLTLLSVARGGVEPPTFRFSGGRSYQLSYLAVDGAGAPTGRGATQTGLEPATFAVTGRRANQLRHWAKLVLR